MLLDSVAVDTNEKSRVPALGILVACSYVVLYVAASQMPPVWLLFRDWPPPEVPVLVTRLVDPGPAAKPAPVGKTAPAVEPARRPKVSRLRSPAASKGEIGSSAVSRAKAEIVVPLPPAPAAPRFDEKAGAYAAAAKDGPLPHFKIDTDYASYVPVMRRFGVELAIGTGYPAPYALTFLYSPGSGALHRGRPPEGTIPRTIPQPLGTPLAGTIRDVAGQLGVAAEAIQVHALYPPELYLGVAGKVREAMNAQGIPDGCAAVSYVSRGPGFDVEVRSSKDCLERNSNHATLR